jgi:hypothetical protein
MSPTTSLQDLDTHSGDHFPNYSRNVIATEAGKYVSDENVVVIATSTDDDITDKHSDKKRKNNSEDSDENTATSSDEDTAASKREETISSSDEDNKFSKTKKDNLIDIPNGNVFQHRLIGDGNPEDDVIGNVVLEAEASSKPTVVTRTVPGRRTLATNRFGFPNKAAKKQKTTNALPAVSDKLLTCV